MSNQFQLYKKPLKMQNSLYLTHFFKEKPICIFLTESKSAQTSIKISPITTNTTQNSIRHKIYTSKKNPSLYSQQDSLQQKSPQKSSFSIPSQKAQKHISQNTSTFEFKRTCVFLQT